MGEPKTTRRRVVQVIGAIPGAALLARGAGAESMHARTGFYPLYPAGGQAGGQRISLDHCVILADSNQPSYVQHGVKDLSEYLSEITGRRVPVASAAEQDAGCVISIGPSMSAQSGMKPPATLGEEGFAIRSMQRRTGNPQIAVCGAHPQGTKYGVIALMKLVRADGQSAFVQGPLDIQSRPRFATRALHLNGWPFKFPYTFRAWREEDWKKFADILSYQGANLFFIWPFMEIMPVPLSAEDEAYLQEVRRVVEYAQKQRGMEVWIMHAANRVAASTCGVRDPRPRPYWADECQVDVNPGEDDKFAAIMRSFEALYRIVNNADGFGMIDSDPGGWPQSPLRDQVKVFKGARQLLDRYNEHGPKAKLIDWMWLGWGRHKYFNATDTVAAAYDWTEKNPDQDDVAFMVETIRAFEKDLPEPWWLIAGFPPYLDSARRAGKLGKTVFLPYGAIEGEPSFPMINATFDPVRKALNALADYPETRGIMGNNQTPLLQLPRTYLLLNAAWDYEYRQRAEAEVFRDLSQHLYPQQCELIADCYRALNEKDPERINAPLAQLEKLVEADQLGRPGVIARKVFPDPQEVARILVRQLRIRAARQALLQGLRSSRNRADCERLVETYLDALLAWNQQTGWDKLIDLGMWRSPIYAADAEFTQLMSRLKHTLSSGSGPTSYRDVASFFQGISQRLLSKYGENSVMTGCIEPMKMAVLRAP